MLEARALNFHRAEQLILNNISFKLIKGQCLHITGPNGAGKTTLIRLLTGLQNLQMGEIFWQEQQIIQKKIPNNQLFYLGHQHGLKPSLTVRENLQWQQILNNDLIDEITIEKILQETQLIPYANHLIKQLSSGWQRRVALARCLLAQKSIWILDEPFNNMDAAAELWFTECMAKHLTNDGLIILTHHHQPNAQLRALISNELSLA